MTLTRLLSSAASQGAPNGQPEPTMRSQVIPREAASPSVNRSSSSHAGLNQSTEAIPISAVLSGKAIGLISTPPKPASLSRRSSRANSAFSILSPFHHQRAKGRLAITGSLNNAYNLSSEGERFSVNPAGNAPASV